MGERLDRLLRDRRPLVLLLLFAASLAVRFLTAEYMDIGGDNSHRWMEARRLAEGLGYSGWTAQTTRWSISLQLWALMKLCGQHPALSYMLPFLYASAGAVFMHLVGERLRGPRLGLAAAVLTILFPQMTQTGSQLWPSVFQVALLGAAVFCILVWLEERRSALPLVLAAAAYILAWGARETAAYFFPGLLLLIWLPSRSWRGLAVFCLASGLMAGLEWFYFWQAAGSTLGRLGITTRVLDNQNPMSPAGYLLNVLNYAKLRGLLPVLLLTLVACGLELRAADPRRRALAATSLMFVFFSTYMPARLSPLELVHPFGTRYWCAGAPLALLSTLLWLGDLEERHQRTAKTIRAALFAGFALFSLLAIPPANAVLQTARDAATLGPAMQAGRPLLLRYQEWRPNAVEAAALRLVGGKPPGEPRQVGLYMRRNQIRTAALHLGDVRRFDDYAFGEVVVLDPARYGELTGRKLEKSEAAALLLPHGASPDAPPAAEVLFDRRQCQALPLVPPR